MNFKELMEGVEPKMPGAPGGIQIMTPQQFVAKAGDMPGQEVDENEEQVDVGPALDNLKGDFEKLMAHGDRMDTDPAYAKKWNKIHAKHTGPHDNDLDDMTGDLEVDEGKGLWANIHAKRERIKHGSGEKMRKPGSKGSPTAQNFKDAASEGVAEGDYPDGSSIRTPGADEWKQQYQQAVMAVKNAKTQQEYEAASDRASRIKDLLASKGIQVGPVLSQQGVAESLEQLNRIRKLSGLAEATKLPAQTRDLKGQEFQDYMKRIAGTPDIDKKTGKVKVGKSRISKRTGEEIPGKEKYVSGKTKSDKYKMPYIHRDSVIKYYSESGQRYDEDQIKKALSQRPKTILKQNEKMQHSNGDQEQFFNVGFAALTGVAVDEQTNNLIIVNTCPGAGSCKVDCFAMKGGKVQFEGPWLSDGRILTYLLNDPDGFFNQVSNEITKEKNLGKKNGYKVTIRWHDAGDFFSPEYMDLAFKLAKAHPDTQFYAYTKMAGAALGDKPDNFLINWSEGAHTSQEKQIKAQDPNLEKTKNSRIVPTNLFYDLLKKDDKGNLIKNSSGAWQPRDEAALAELKQRLAKQYGISANSILSYNEYKSKNKNSPLKYNVIVAPHEPDLSAKDPGVLSTLLLQH